MFAAIITKSNIICMIEQLSQFNSNLFSKHLLAMKWILRYFKNMSKFDITYSSSVICFVDYLNADWTENINMRWSMTDYMMMLNHEMIAWRNKWQIIVALFIMKAKYMIIIKAAKKLKWMRRFLTELKYNDNKSTMILKLNNQKMIALTKNSINHSRIKHIDLHHHFIKNAIENEII